MDKKCEKYKTFFVFSSENELENHIKECDICKKEHLKMQKISALVKEVKPYIVKRKIFSNSYLQKIAAGIFIIGLTFFAVNNFSTNYFINSQNIAYNNDKSIIEEMGLPTDDYGLLMVD